MPQDLHRRPPRYHVFLLSLWEEAGSAPNWRCRLEDPHTGRQIGFKSLEDLAAYLKNWTPGPAQPRPNQSGDFS